MPIAIGLLVLAYPVLLYLGVHVGHVDWAVHYLAGLLILPAALAARQGQWPGAMGLLALVLAGTLLALPAWYDMAMIRLLPVLTNGFVFGLFAITLRPGSVPLVSRIASIARNQPELNDRVKRYTRQATLGWAIYFLLMTLAAATLGMFATIEVWSLFANLLSYLLLLPAFLVEFVVRQIVLGNESEQSLAEFLANLRKIRLKDFF